VENHFLPIIIASDPLPFNDIGVLRLTPISVRLPKELHFPMKSRQKKDLKYRNSTELRDKFFCDGITNVILFPGTMQSKTTKSYIFTYFSVKIVFSLFFPLAALTFSSSVSIIYNINIYNGILYILKEA
jgi:hypothetical protein